MSWGEMKQALQNMPDSGPDGFEGLAAILLQNLLRDTFVCARSGDQPSGDARTLRGDVVIQAKRYKEGTSLDAKNIEGDLREARRAVPNLEVYVLAITR